LARLGERCPVLSEDEYPDYETPVGRLTVIREDEEDAKKGYPYNKDVYLLYRNDKGEVLQEKLISKNKRDHWMKEIPDEYKGWPIMEIDEIEED
jgi:hypothetical protein